MEVGACRFVVRRRASSAGAALLAAAVGLYLLPSPVDPEPHVLKGPPPALEGPLAANTRLQKGRRLFQGKLRGPEPFPADEAGNVYTGTADGKLWRVGPGQPDFGRPDGPRPARMRWAVSFLRRSVGRLSADVAETCLRRVGVRQRPGLGAGVRLDRHGDLIVADAYPGLFSVDPRSGRKTLPVSNWRGAGGVPFAFLNGLAVSPQSGLIYFTDSSSRWGRRHVRLEVVSLSWYKVLLPRYALVLELDPDGQLVGSMHDPEGRLTWAVSEAFRRGDRIFLGNTDLPFLPVVTLHT